MSEQNEQREARNTVIKIAFGIATLVCLATGLVVYIFAARLGLSEDTARYVALAFLAAGVGDYIILKFWDRIMAGR